MVTYSRAEGERDEVDTNNQGKSQKASVKQTDSIAFDEFRHWLNPSNGSILPMSGPGVNDS